MTLPHAMIQAALLTALLAPLGMIFARLHRLSRRIPGVGVRAGALGVALFAGFLYPIVWHGAVMPAPEFGWGGRWAPTWGREEIGWLAGASALLLGMAWWAQRRRLLGLLPLLTLAAGMPLAFVVMPGRLDIALMGAGLGAVWCDVMIRLSRPDRTPLLLLAGVALMCAAPLMDYPDWCFFALVLASAAATAAAIAWSPWAVGAGADAHALAGLWLGTMFAEVAWELLPLSRPDDRSAWVVAVFAGLWAIVRAVEASVERRRLWRAAGLTGSAAGDVGSASPPRASPPPAPPPA